MAWHARKSASGSKQWLTCPGSLAYVESLPAALRRGTNDAAMLGTAAHGLGEHCLRKGLREVPEDLFGTLIWLDGNEDAHLTEDPCEGIETTSQLSADMQGVEVKFMTRVDEKMRDGVQLYLDVCWEGFDEMGEGTEMYVERTFDMDWLRPGLGGTSDCTLWQFLGLLRIIDYKNGYVAVSADDNTQALTYALGTAQTVDWMFEEVEVVIVQPNSHGESVKRWSITREELEAFRERLAKGSDLVDEAGEALEACEDEADFQDWASTYLDAGDNEELGKHCTFCDAAATCPAAIAKAEELAMADFRDDVPEGNPLEVHDGESLERLVKLIKWGPFLDRLVKAAETLGQRRLEQGLEVPGHKLVRGKTNRAFPSDEEVIDALTKPSPELLKELKLEDFKGFDKDELYEPPKPRALRSPAQMETLGKARSKDRKAAKLLVGKIAFKPEGKLTMAPESDPREEVVLGDAAGDFAEDLNGGGE